MHAKDGIQPWSEKPRFLRPTGFSGGTTFVSLDAPLKKWQIWASRLADVD